MKTPEAMRYIDGPQRHIEKLSVVGKPHPLSIMSRGSTASSMTMIPNMTRSPDSKDAIGQYLFLFSMSAKPADLDNVIDYQAAKAKYGYSSRHGTLRQCAMSLPQSMNIKRQTLCQWI